MTPSLGDLLDFIDQMAPFALAETWDNSGLQIGDRQWPCSKILVALDVTPAVMAEAVSWGADLVLTHHPLIMSPLASIDFSSIPGSIISLCACHRISVVSAHTNLDKANPGLNDYFVQKIGLVSVGSLEPLIPEKQTPFAGTGRVLTLKDPCTFRTLSEQVRSSLNVSGVRCVGGLDMMVERVAVCTGSGGSLVKTFLESGADVFITGDVKYHEARDAEQAGVGLLDVGHFASERMVVDLFCERLTQWAQTSEVEVKVRVFDGESDPFRIVGGE
ncbi:MAG: Nif3-like dinuclear metal center hexameric protein [Desulfobacterium sp.]|nr:Nif3-like dinuclear metal center hexameric protein [Desulfobacterium sp.]